MKKTLIIRKLTRFPNLDPSDELNFQPGVNIIVGAPNAGKTQWLKMLDYLMGDSDPVEQAFNLALVEKYDSIRADIEIGEEKITLSRHWKGLRSKVYVNDKPIDATDLSDFLLEKLGMPIQKFQSGGLMSSRGWVSLSWRVLLRHIYRKSSSWSEIANKQPEQEQRACLLFFTGIADSVFSAERQELAEKQRKLITSEAEKEQFLSSLQRIAKDLFDEKELMTGLTPDLIQKTIVRLQLLATENEQTRISRLELLQSQIAQTQTNNLEQLKERWASLELEYQEILNQLERAQARLKELIEYQNTVRAESEKLDRATSAAQVFDDLRVTHCPVCHKPVKQRRFGDHTCFMCGQPDEIPEFEEETSKRRLEFEREQLKAEKLEADDLVLRATSNLKSMQERKQSLEEIKRQLEVALHPVRQAISALRDPDISRLEMEYGRIQERINQLHRALASLNSRQDFNQEIRQLNQEINVLQTKINQMDDRTDRNAVSDILTDGIIEYLSFIHRIKPSAWTRSGEDVKIRISQGSFSLTIGGQNWESKLGETLKLYFLFAYNYTLLRITNREWSHYPGLSIIDLPAQFNDGSKISDEENFILLPFIELLNQPEMKNTQLICTGSSFQDLEKVNRIVLNTIWD